MTDDWPTPMAWPMAYPNGVARCYGTERYGTERKSLQDPDENPSVPDRSGPVDNPESIDEEVSQWTATCP